MRNKELHLDDNGQTFINTYVSEDADSGTDGRSAYLSALLWFALKKVRFHDSQCLKYDVQTS